MTVVTVATEQPVKTGEVAARTHDFTRFIDPRSDSNPVPGAFYAWYLHIAGEKGILMKFT